MKRVGVLLLLLGYCSSFLYTSYTYYYYGRGFTFLPDINNDTYNDFVRSFSDYPRNSYRRLVFNYGGTFINDDNVGGDEYRSSSSLQEFGKAISKGDFN